MLNREDSPTEQIKMTHKDTGVTVSLNVSFEPVLSTIFSQHTF